MNTDAIYNEMVVSIVKEQEGIIGPLAIEQANNVENLHVDPQTFAVEISGDRTTTIDALVAKYQEFFGQAAVEVCREAVSRVAQQLKPEQLPASFK